MATINDKKGYDIILYFLGTNNLNINKQRVKKRVKEGGHEVAESIIEHRYRMGLSYLKSKVLIFKKAYIIDNSKETYKVMAVLDEGKISQKEKECSQWVEDVLMIAKLLQKKSL